MLQPDDHFDHDKHDHEHDEHVYDAAARSDYNPVHQHKHVYGVNDEHDAGTNDDSQAAPEQHDDGDEHDEHDQHVYDQHNADAAADHNDPGADDDDHQHNHDHDHSGADDDSQAAADTYDRRTRHEHDGSTMTKPKVSVAIAALNEGAQLEATIGCIRAGLTVPDEIVVYDDCGAERVKPMEGVQVRRGQKRIGSGPAKHAAIDACSGDLVIVMDGHCRPAIDWLDHLMDEHRRHPWAVMCTTCVGIEGASYRNGAHRGMGGRLDFSDHVGFWEVKWAEIRNGIHSYNTPTVVGGCYAIPRCVLNAIGGYAPAYFGYGVEEEYLGIRTWMVGGECRMVPRSVVGHWFNRTFSRATADGAVDKPWEQHYNRHVCARVCFEDGVYERVYRPRLAKYGEDPEMMTRLDESKDLIEAARAIIQSNRIVRDAALADWAGLQHPSGA